MLETRDLVFGYPKQDTLFKELNIEVGRDERVAIEAPSGFGKTTLCRLLAGYLSPQKGAVLLDGKPVPKRGVSPIQLIWQHPEKAVDPRLRMKRTLEEAGSVSSELLEGLGIEKGWLSRYPHELSGGELQRFCIARALAAEPAFLIADEISTMLDAVTQAQLWQFLLEVIERQSIGLVFVSHSPALSKRIATRTVFLENQEE